jgi:hypothetical protein
MNLPQIYQLTPEQEATIPVYLNKWRKIAFSIEPINQEQAANSMKAGYAAVGIEEPRIIFCDSPFLGLVPHILWFGSYTTPLARQLREILGDELGDMYQFRKLEESLFQQLEKQISNSLLEKLECQLNDPLISQVEGLQLEKKLLENQEIEMERIVSGEFLESEKYLLKKLLVEDPEYLINCQREYELDEDLLTDTTMWQIDGLSQLCILSSYWASKASLFDFSKAILNCEIPQQTWEVYQAIAQYCSFIYPFEKVCVICERLSVK